MADILVVPPIVLLAPLILELVAEVSVELLGVLWLQPTSANVAKTVIANNVIIDFISSLFHFCCRQHVFASSAPPAWRSQGGAQLCLRPLFLHGRDVLQMRLHHRNGFVQKTFYIRVLRCGGFGFESLGIIFVAFDHGGDIGIVEC